MPARTVIFRLLAKAKDPSADDALAAALEGADFVTTKAIVETLLLRARPRGYLALVSAFHRLEPTLHDLVLSKIDRMFSGLRKAMLSRDEQVRVNVMDLIRLGRAYRAAYLLDPALHDRSARVREAATETLHTLASDFLEPPPAAAESDLYNLSPEQIERRMADLAHYAEDRLQVAGAVEAALACFNVHLQPRVAEAALWFVDDLGPRFWSLITVPGCRAAHAAISVFLKNREPQFVPFAIGALKYGEFRPHVIKVLSACTEPKFLAEWLRNSWRLVQPKTAKGASALKELQCVQHGAEVLLQITAEQQHIARWIAATGLADKVKIGAIKEVQRRGTPPARRSTVWTVTATK